MKTMAMLCLLAAALTAGAEPPPATPPCPLPKEPAPSAASSTGAARRTNSLGMVFAPVPETAVWFSIWETRVQDFQAFVEATGHDTGHDMCVLRADGGKVRPGFHWRNPGFPQGPTHPVTGVNWDDARAFCRWLTEKEQKEGRLTAEQRYRLPTDLEWSRAVGLPTETAATPKERDSQIQGVYPWGRQWPPPPQAGNFAGREARDADWMPSSTTLDGYDDGQARTAPAGQFPPNQHGLHDLGGNVWEWCEDWFDAQQKGRVLRGAAWFIAKPEFMLSSYRRERLPESRFDCIGFRVVLTKP